MTIPDEISDAAAYQQSLPAALGGDDPAAAQATTPAAIPRRHRRVSPANCSSPRRDLQPALSYGPRREFGA